MSNKDGSDGFEMRRQLLQLEMLYEVGVAINESLDPSYVTQEILQRAMVMVDARCGALFVADAQGQLVGAGAEGLSEDPATWLQVPSVRQAWERRELTHGSRGPVGGESSSCAHVCAVPLISRQEAVGLLVMGDREQRGGSVGPFAPADEVLLRSFANQAGSALHNARLHGSLEAAYAELQAAQRKLAQLEQLRALGELSAEVAHSMRHILGVIIGRADTFLSFAGDPQRTVRAIMDTAESGQHLIDRLHQCTRLGVGRRRERVDLGTLVHECVEAAKAYQRQQHGDAAPEIIWTVKSGPVPSTYANQADLRDVFGNLVINALEALAAGGCIDVTVQGSAEHITVRIQDDGPGMSGEVLEQAFRPFFTTKEETGTGLGLSIAYRIVEDHGGDIELHSEPGSGTQVIVRLPVRSEPPPVEDQRDAAAGLDS